MGRHGSQLVTFLHQGLNSRKYRNLIMENALLLIFCITFPHKTKKLNKEDEYLFKDWYTLKGKKYIFGSKHYTDARQAMTASLRKSDYLEKVHLSDNKLKYRILNEAEILEKKRQKKEKQNRKRSDSDDTLSSVESDYRSGLDSPRSDHGIVPQNDGWIVPSENELPNVFPNSESNSLYEANDGQPANFDFKNFIKSEPMDTVISAENSTLVDSSILFEDTFLTDSQSFAEFDLNSGNVQPQCPNLNITKCESKSLRLTEDFPIKNEASNGFDSLQLPNLFDADFNNLPSNEFLDFLDVDFPLVPEDNSSRLPEVLLNQLVEGISTLDSHCSVVDEENKDQNSLLDDLDLSGNKDELENVHGPKGKFYICKKCVYLGKTPILFCEPQVDACATDTFDEIKIIFDDSVPGNVIGSKSVKEFKCINDHLLVILEP